MRKNQQNKVIAGVCSGLADKFQIDALLVRLIFVFAFLWFGAGILLYLILWFLMD